MRLTHPFETLPLNQLHNPAKPGLPVERQGVKLFSNAVVKELYDPRHPSTLLHFCNIHKGELRGADQPIRSATPTEAHEAAIHLGAPSPGCVTLAQMWREFDWAEFLPARAGGLRPLSPRFCEQRSEGHVGWVGLPALAREILTYFAKNSVGAVVLCRRKSASV